MLNYNDIAKNVSQNGYISFYTRYGCDAEIELKKFIKTLGNLVDDSRISELDCDGEADWYLTISRCDANFVHLITNKFISFAKKEYDIFELNIMDDNYNFMCGMLSYDGVEIFDAKSDSKDEMDLWRDTKFASIYDSKLEDLEKMLASNLSNGR